MQSSQMKASQKEIEIVAEAPATARQSSMAEEKSGPKTMDSVDEAGSLASKSVANKRETQDSLGGTAVAVSHTSSKVEDDAGEKKKKLIGPAYIRYTVDSSSKDMSAKDGLSASQTTTTSKKGPNYLRYALNSEPSLPALSLLPTEVPPEEEAQPGAFRQAGVNGSVTSNNNASSSAFTYYNNNNNASANTLDSLRGSALSNLSNSNLVKANLVTSSRQFRVADLEVAEPIQEEGEEDHLQHVQARKASKRLLIVGCLGVLLVATAIAVVVVLVAKKNPSSDSHTNLTGEISSNDNETTTTPTPTLEPLLALLPESTQSVILQDPNLTQPQSKAYQWLLNDPNMTTYSDARLLQRYAMATFYYSTDGDNWNEKGGGWLVVQSGALGVGVGGGGGRPPQGGSRPQGGRPQQGGGGGWGSRQATGNRQRPNGGNGGGGGSGRPQGQGNGGGGGGRPPGQGGSSGGPPTRFCPQSTCNVTFGQWMDYTSHECTWYSSFQPMCWANDTVQAISFVQNALRGSLPEELALLSSLQSLRVHTNNVGGTIPTILGMLTQLNQIRLNANQMTGTVPSEIGQLSNSLEVFEVLDNQLQGKLPPQLWRLSKLRDIRLNKNSFSGTIPENIGELMPNLYQVFLWGTQLGGSLPSSLGKCTGLGSLHVQETQLTGSLPTEMGLLTQLKILAAHTTKLSGVLPSQLGKLTRLRGVLLHDNIGLNSSIPEEWVSLNLLEFNVEGTALTGTIPSRLCQVPQLSYNCSMLCGCAPCEC